MYSTPSQRRTRQIMSELLYGGRNLSAWDRYRSKYRQAPYGWDMPKVSKEYRKTADYQGPYVRKTDRPKRELTEYNIFYANLRKQNPDWPAKRIRSEWKAHKRTMGIVPKRKKKAVVKGKRALTEYNIFYADLRRQHPEWKGKKIRDEWKADKKRRGIVTKKRKKYPAKKRKKRTRARAVMKPYQEAFWEGIDPAMLAQFTNGAPKKAPFWAPSPVGAPVARVPETWETEEAMERMAEAQEIAQAEARAQEIAELEEERELMGFGLRGGSWQDRINGVKRMIPNLSRKMALDVGYGGKRYTRRRGKPATKKYKSRGQTKYFRFLEAIRKVRPGINAKEAGAIYRRMMA